MTQKMGTLHTACSSLVFLLLLFLTIARTTRANLLTDVCRQTPLPPSCEEVLGSDPRSKSTTVPQELAQIAIDMARTKVLRTGAKLEELLVRAGTGSYFAPFCKVCLNHYNTAARNLGIATDELKGAMYPELRDRAVTVGMAIDTCEDYFGKFSPVKNDAETIRPLVSAIAAIAGDLSQ